MAPLRSLLLEFEEDEIARGITDQFMLGSVVMMAPVFDERADQIDIYLPKGVWTHLFTGQTYDLSGGGMWLRDQPSPIG